MFPLKFLANLKLLGTTSFLEELTTFCGGIYEQVLFTTVNYERLFVHIFSGNYFYRVGLPFFLFSGRDQANCIFSKHIDDLGSPLQIERNS